MTKTPKWKLAFSQTADKTFSKLDGSVARKILRYMEERVLKAEDPTVYAKPLSGNLQTYWRFRIDDYRLICDIDGHVMTIYVLHLGHRRDVYHTHS